MSVVYYIIFELNSTRIMRNVYIKKRDEIFALG
jgi:hypothetical protein